MLILRQIIQMEFSLKTCLYADRRWSNWHNIQYLRRLLRSDKLEGIKIGSIWLIEMQSLEAYLQHVEITSDHRCGPRYYFVVGAFTQSLNYLSTIGLSSYWMAERRTPGARSPGGWRRIKFGSPSADQTMSFFRTWDGLWKTSLIFWYLLVILPGGSI